MPPQEGIAIGTIISDPRPVEVKTGSKARMVVALVIKHGRIRRITPSLRRHYPISSLRWAYPTPINGHTSNY